MENNFEIQSYLQGSQLLIQIVPNVLKVLKNKRKYENLQLHVTRRSSSADENHVTRRKAPEKLLNGPCGEIEL